MTPAEEARLCEAGERAKTAPQGEHVEFRWRDSDPKDMLGCVKCGGIKPRKGWSDKPCRGWTRVELRGKQEG